MEHFGLTDSPRLSILICHLKDRAEVFSPLLRKLNVQIKTSPLADILINDREDLSIGQKRNELLFFAGGKYVAFIDDDDDVSDDYVTSIIKATETAPDCVGIEGLLVSNAGNFLFKHSCRYQGWYTAPECFYRTPNHLNPVKRVIARGIGFPDKNNGEDQWYSDRLRRALRTEVYVDHPIYFYKKTYPIAEGAK